MGNRNKHLLAAERRRTDEATRRLNKQNPVSPQNKTPNDERTELSKTQAQKINFILDGIPKLVDMQIDRSELQ